MRHTTTALVILAALGMTIPALALEPTGATTLKPAQAGQSTTRHTGTDAQTGSDTQMQVESHLKAAGYDIMQARQMIQAKDSKMAREMITSARNHVQMAQDAAPSTIASQIRRIETTLEQAEKVARTDVNKASQQVAQANTELQKLIKQERAHGGGSSAPRSGQ